MGGEPRGDGQREPRGAPQEGVDQHQAVRRAGPGRGDRPVGVVPREGAQSGPHHAVLPVLPHGLRAVFAHPPHDRVQQGVSEDLLLERSAARIQCPFRYENKTFEDLRRRYVASTEKGVSLGRNNGLAFLADAEVTNLGPHAL